MSVSKPSRLQRTARTAVAGGIAAALFAMPPSTTASAVAGPCWRPPVVGVVVDPFRAPPCTWCAGNRGLEFAVDDAAVIRAAATGTVTFAGSVVGVGYVVVDTAAGWKLTYGRLTHIDVAVGAVVIAGQVIGRASTSFFFGLRVDGVYTDPAPFIGTLRGRARLVPLDGSPGRPPGPTTIRCQGEGRRR